MTTETRALEATTQDPSAVLERVIVAGDLAKLSPADRVRYYGEVCRSLGLNPFTQPFSYIVLNGKLTLYATRTAADQLRAIKGISIDSLTSETVDDLYIVTAHGRDTTGRTDSEVGAVAIAGLRGEAKANAILKATTKAKRRLTLSLSGLGWLDEDGAVPSAEAVDVDVDTGELRSSRQPRSFDERLSQRRAQIEARTTPVAAPEPVEAPAEEAQQCESTSDPRLGEVERCRKSDGHDGPHRSTNATWPR